VNIVIFKLSPLGDTVMMLPVVQTLRRLHPDWRITVFATPATAALFRDTVRGDDLVVMNSVALKRCWRRPWQLWSWWRRVRGLRPDAVFLSYDQSSVARFLARASGARVRLGGAGSAIRWQGGLTHTLGRNPAHSLAEWDWAMAGVMMRELGHDWPDSPPPPVLGPAMASKKSRGRPRVVIHAGASREYQRWLPERFAALAKALARDCDVVWIERAEVSVAAPAGSEVFPPGDLDSLVRLFAGADLFVGNHSGAFHLAAALGKSCVVIAGPSPLACDPAWHRGRHHILRAPGLACLPCEQLSVTVDVCRNFSAPMACMKHWSVEAVETVCRDALRSSTGGAAPP